MKQFELEVILASVKHIMNIDLTKVIKSQSRKNTDARRVYTLLARKYSLCSLSDIGELVGKDHTSVIHYKKTGDELISLDKKFENEFIKCEQYLINSYYDYRKKRLLSHIENFKTDFRNVKSPFLQQIELILNKQDGKR